MALEKIVRCRIILPDGFQVNGDFKISNSYDFERWLYKNVEYDHKQDITEIIFEMVDVKEVKDGRKGKEF